MTEKRSFEKGAVIFKEHSWELSMYDIVSGKVGIYANYGKENESLLTELEAGRYFGEMGVIDAMTRSATAVALEDTVVTVIDSSDFEAYLNENPDKIIDIFQNLCMRLRELSDSYVDACETVTEYVEAKEAEKPKGLLAKIKKLLSFSEEYAQIAPDIYNEALMIERTFILENTNGYWYF